MAVENRIELGIEYFPDPNVGRPLFNANIYIGIPDLDPEIEANRITVSVIQENGTRVPLLPSAQPLLTNNGGVITYNGDPVVIVTDKPSYSIKATSQLGAQIYYVPEVRATNTVGEWKEPGFAATYVNATTFTLVGDQTDNYKPGIRGYSTGGADRYWSILTSIFGVLTTVTVKNTVTGASPPVASTLHASMDTAYVSINSPREITFANSVPFNTFDFDKNRPLNVVIDFGADNTGVVDSLAAFDNALAAANILNKREIFVPAGEYNMSGSLVLPGTGFTLRGEGETIAYENRAATAAATVLKWSSATVNCVELTSNTVIANYESLVNITIDGNAVGQNGVVLTGACYLNGVKVVGTTVAGIEVGTQTNQTIIERATVVSNTGHGIHVAAGTTTILNISKTNIRENTGKGLFIEGGSLVSFTDMVIESNGDAGISIYDNRIGGHVPIDRLVFRNVWLENNAYLAGTTYALEIDSASSTLYESPGNITFDTCSISAPDILNHKYMNLNRAWQVTFKKCVFSGGDSGLTIAQKVVIASNTFTTFFEDCSGGNLNTNSIVSIPVALNNHVYRNNYNSGMRWDKPSGYQTIWFWYDAVLSASVTYNMKCQFGTITGYPLAHPSQKMQIRGLKLQMDGTVTAGTLTAQITTSTTLTSAKSPILAIGDEAVLDSVTNPTGIYKDLSGLGYELALSETLSLSSTITTDGSFSRTGINNYIIGVVVEW